MLDVKTFFRSVSLRAPQRCLRPAALLTSCGVLAILQACSSTPKAFQPDLFSTTASPYAHSFVATNAQACEAARRAMLSQGYTTTAATADAVDANKGFQPGPEVHVVVSFHVVCTPSESANGSSTLYVNAIQDNYGLKKTDTSATVGLSILGSLSLPIRSNNDSMVKFSSQTIPPGAFYDRFFALVDHYLKNVVRSSPVGDDASIAESPLAPLPTPAAVLSRSAPPIPVEVGGASAPGPNVTPLAPTQAGPATATSAAPAASAPAAASMPAAASASAPAAASDTTSQPTSAQHARKSKPASAAANSSAPASSASAPASTPAVSAPPAASAASSGGAVASASAASSAPEASPSAHPSATGSATASSATAASSPSAASSASGSQNSTASASSSTPASATNAASSPTTP